WRIFPEYVGGRNQYMVRHRARRQLLAGKQTQGERQHIVAVAVHVVGDRAEHDTAPVVGVDLLLLAGTAVDVPVEPLADDDAVALPPIHFNGILGIHGGQVIEGRDQHSLTALRLQKFRQQRVSAHRLSPSVQRREVQRRQPFVYAFGDALHAIADGGTEIGEITDEYPAYLLVRPCL